MQNDLENQKLKTTKEGRYFDSMELEMINENNNDIIVDFSIVASS